MTHPTLSPLVNHATARKAARSGRLLEKKIFNDSQAESGENARKIRSPRIFLYRVTPSGVVGALSLPMDRTDRGATRMSPRPPTSAPTPHASARPKLPVTLGDEIRSSAEAATWLGPSDQAAVELAVFISGMVEVGLRDPEAARATAPLASTLARLLSELGLTSKGRPQGNDTTEEVSWLDELRKRREAATPARKRAPSSRDS